MLSGDLPNIIEERKWAKFEIGEHQPYQRYEALPLISCSAYLFRYTSKDNREIAIFYHAKSGLPYELGEIAEQIKNDGVALKNVSLFIASPDDASNPSHKGSINFTAKKRNKLFQLHG